MKLRKDGQPRKKFTRNAKPKFVVNAEYIEARCIPEPNTGCWLWTAGLDSSGYGSFRIKPNPHFSAHRASYMIYRGPIPQGLSIDHVCRVRCCVNPDHLEAVTHIENCARRVYPELCRYGHKYDGIRKHGGRPSGVYCKECSRQATKKYLARKKLERAEVAV